MTISLMRTSFPTQWRILPPAMLLFFAVGLGAAPAPTGPIPGVDEIPRPAPSGELPVARENLKQEPKKEEPKKEEPKKEEPKKEEPKKEEPKKEEPKKEEPKKEEPKKEEPKKAEDALPVVRALQVKRHPDQPTSLVLSWQVRPDNKAPIYVGRYREQVRTRDQVLDADNLTAPALGPQVTTFTDSKIPDGTYFYVVVTGAEMRPGYVLVLKGGENTTVEGVAIKRTQTDVRPKGDEGPPAVRNLRAVPHPDRKGAAVLTWDLSGKASDTIILRHRKPIANEAAFREAKRVAILRPWARHYVDRDVPSGTYYYAAYLQRETRGDLTLKEGQNYTTEAFASDFVAPKKEPDPKATEKDFRASGLIAVNGQKSVKLSWRGARAAPVVYRIYRGEEPLENEKSLRRAKLLGERDEAVNFEDNEAIADRRLYYGVTVTDPRTGKEYANLEEGVNYRAHVYQPQVVPKNLESLLPDALTTFLKDSHTVMLFWAEPDTKVEGYRIYRHDRPIDSVARLKDAKLIGRLEGAANRFEDAEPPAGRHYYALLPLDEKGTEVREFVERRTFTGFGVETEARAKKEEPKKEEPKKEEPKKEEPKKEEPKKEEPKRAEPRLLVLRGAVDERDIVVSWEAEVPAGVVAKLRLYRGSDPLQTLRQVEERGVFVEEVDPASGVFRDANLEPGKYYYAALLEVDGRLQSRMLMGRNFLAQGLRVEKPPSKKEEPDRPVKKEEPTTDIQKGPTELELMRTVDAILRQTYARGRFSAAVRELHQFGTRRNPPKVRAKAMFYTGLSYYRMGRYRDSVDYFLNFRVQEEYRERAQFYYRRALERLR